VIIYLFCFLLIINVSLVYLLPVQGMLGQKLFKESDWLFGSQGKTDSFIFRSLVYTLIQVAVE